MTEYKVLTVGGCDGCLRRCGDTTFATFDNFEEALALATLLAETQELFTQIAEDDFVIWDCNELRY